MLAWEKILFLDDPILTDLKDEEFILKLRNNPRKKKTTLIALSSDPGPSRREAYINAGVDEYLVKSSQALVSLREILRSRSAHRFADQNDDALYGWEFCTCQ